MGLHKGSHEVYLGGVPLDIEEREGRITLIINLQKFPRELENHSQMRITIKFDIYSYI